MQNIDPVYFLTPIITIGFSVGLVVYWRLKKSLPGRVLLYALLAYAGAIGAKVALQLATYQRYSTAVGGSPIALGVYFGLQTMVLEVGGAYIVARYAVSRGKVGPAEAGGFGISLAFWENGVLIGGELLLTYAASYAVIASGGSLATTVANQLTASSPGLFYEPARALPLVGAAVSERVSSLLVHFAWGTLVVLAASYRRKGLLAAALPMGLIDFFVPLGLPIVPLEAAFFAVGILSVVAMAYLKSHVSKTGEAASRVGSQGRQDPNPITGPS